MGKEGWMTDPRFDSFATRSANMDEDALINEWTRQYTRQQLLEITQAAGVICAPVNDLNDVVNDPHLMLAGRSKPQSTRISARFSKCIQPYASQARRRKHCRRHRR